MAVHILCCGVDNDISSELEGAAENGSCECVVNNEGNVVAVSDSRKALDIENVESGVCDSLTENETGALVKESVDLVVCHAGSNEAHFNAEALECNCEKVCCTAVNGGGANEVVACVCNVENTACACRLTAGYHHSANAALKRSDLLLNVVNGGVRDTGVHMAGSCKVEELSEMLAGLVFICSALVNRKNSCLTVFGLVAFLNALCFDFVIIHRLRPLFL